MSEKLAIRFIFPGQIQDKKILTPVYPHNGVVDCTSSASSLVWNKYKARKKCKIAQEVTKMRFKNV